MKHVVILQEYVPKYREAFFEQLIELGRRNDIIITIAAGQPERSQSRRGDLSQEGFWLPVKQRELRIAGKRIVLRRIGRTIKNADLVILEQARRNLDAYRLLLRRRPNIKVALWGHGKDYVKATSKLDNALQAFLTKRCDWFFAYTYSGGRAVQELGFPSSRITVLGNSIDTKEIVRESRSISEKDLEEFRVEHGLTDNVAVFLGGLDESKRIPFLLESAEIAYSLDNAFRLHIVGDGIERHLVEKKAKTCPGLIYSGPLVGRKKALALVSAKVIAMPGRVGLIAVDSFAVGRPVVTTEWPWHAPEYDYLSNGLDSLVLRNDPESYAKGLVQLMGDATALSELQGNCHAKSLQYTVESMAESYLAGIVKVLESKGA